MESSPTSSSLLSPASFSENISNVPAVGTLPLPITIDPRLLGTIQSELDTNQLRKSNRLSNKVIDTSLSDENSNGEHTSDNDKKSKGKKRRKRSAEDGPPEKKVKKPHVAKKVEWNDIPNWNGREDCPLLQLPEEIIDLCFGLNVNVGLTMRDYVSLAGVSRLFRNRMTNSVFHELLASPNSDGNTYISNTPRTNHAHRIFTRTLEGDWRLPKKQSFAYPSKADHYIPRGDRSQWSEAQYIVYKEEQYCWKRKWRNIEKTRIEKLEQDKRDRKAAMQRSVEVGGMTRTVMARVRGREDGAIPVKKDGDGQPEEVYQLDIYKEQNVIPRNNNDRNEDITSIPQHIKERIERKIKEIKRTTIGGVWETPDSSSENDQEDEDEDEDGGPRIQPTFWPSEYRQKAVDIAHRKFIGKSEAMREFKVTDAELLCLKHILVPNSMRKECPQQVFWHAAVEALAYRSHGGPIGHKNFVKRANELSEKIANTRKRNAEKAKEEGTFVEKKRKHRLLPSEWKKQQKNPSTRSSTSTNTNNAGSSGNTNGDITMDENDQDNHQWCKEGCNCQKDPYKRDHIPTRRYGGDDGSDNSDNSDNSDDD